MARFEIGTVSEGTLRTEDLLPAFADALMAFPLPTILRSFISAHKVDQLVREANGFDWDSEDAEQNASELINEIAQEINAMCPPFVYFGSLAGDGACFGFWPDHDEIQEAQRFGTVYEADREYIYSDDHGVWTHVNDHGNVMVLTDDDGKPGNEIWSAV